MKRLITLTVITMTLPLIVSAYFVIWAITSRDMIVTYDDGTEL